MKNKILLSFLFSVVVFSQFSCRKEWICTCTAQSFAAGQANLDIHDTIGPTVKPAAQADCSKFCNDYFNHNSGYTNQSYSITQD